MKTLTIAILLVVACVTSSEKRNDDVSLESLVTLVQQQAATINSLQSRLSTVEATVQQNTHSITNVDSKVGAATTRLNTRVSFIARMSHGGLISDSPFLFDAVVSNIGNGLNSHTGVFTAPVSGDYVFYAQILGDLHAARVDWGIYKGSQMLCYTLVDDHVSLYNTASCFAPVHLQKGDAVFVKRTNTATSIVGGAWCNFSGQLISADP